MTATPQAVPQIVDPLQSVDSLSQISGINTTIALQHLIFEGTLDKFPGLKILAAHGGGYFGSYAPRSDVACSVSPQNCDPAIVLKKKPSEYLKQITFDSLVFTPLIGNWQADSAPNTAPDPDTPGDKLRARPASPGDQPDHGRQVAKNWSRHRLD